MELDLTNPKKIDKLIDKTDKFSSQEVDNLYNTELQKLRKNPIKYKKLFNHHIEFLRLNRARAKEYERRIRQ